MSKAEQLRKQEYSQKEILQEIFEKFKKLRSFEDAGATAHLILNVQLFEKLKTSIDANKIGYSGKMPMKVAYPTSNKLNLADTSGIPHNLEGELFSLINSDTDEKTIALSCVAMPIDESELDEDWDPMKFLAKMAEGPWKILFSKASKKAKPSIYLAKLRDGVFKISAHHETLEKISLD